MAINIIDAPKQEPIHWLTYKALLTQTGEDAPVARVLNQDEEDYLSGVVITRTSAGFYSLNFPGREDGNDIFPEVSIRNYQIGGDNSSANLIDFIINNTGVNLVYSSDNIPTDVNCWNFMGIEIKVRQRGTAPVLLSAETNEAGDKVILTFDKKMSYYITSGTVPFQIRNLTKDDFVNISDYIVNETLLSFTVDIEQTINISHLDIIKLNCFDLFEALDYGALELFENFPVTNNVV